MVRGQRVILSCVVFNYSGIVQWTKDGLALGIGDDLWGETSHSHPGLPPVCSVTKTEFSELTLILSDRSPLAGGMIRRPFKVRESCNFVRVFGFFSGSAYTTITAPANRFLVELVISLCKWEACFVLKARFMLSEALATCAGAESRSSLPRHPTGSSVEAIKGATREM